MNEQIAVIESWLNEQIGCPYIFGGTMHECTPDYRRTQMRNYEKYADLITNNCQILKSTGSGRPISTCSGCKWAINGKGRPAYDCAQLVRFAMKQIGIILVSGANPQWLKTAFAVTGDIADMPKDMMCIVYRKDPDKKMHHTGMYMGNGYVIHAKGHNYGVVKEKLESIKFTHFAIPAGLYTNAELRNHGFEPGFNLPTLRRGAAGESVKKFQNGMKTLKYAVLVDGIFGEASEKVAKTFQKEHGLTVDGVVGPKTWAVFVSLFPETVEEDTKTEPTDEMPMPLDNMIVIPKEVFSEWTKSFENLLTAMSHYM